MVKRATSLVLALLLLTGIYSNIPAKAQVTATPTQAVITVSGVPANTTNLAVEVTVDSSVVTLGGASTSASGAIAASGSNGVGVVSTTGSLPDSFTITVGLTGVAVGTSAVTLGNVKDTLGSSGVVISGVTAMADTSSVTVASSSTTTSSTTSSSSSTGGGTLSTDTFTIMVTGEAVKQTTALNVTLAFADSSIAQLDTTGVTVTGSGITQLLTNSDSATSVVSAVWSGTSTDGTVTITGKLKPGTMGGTTTVGIAKVEAAGGTDITSNVVASVDPTSITNGSGSSSSGVGSFTLIGPSSATGPGKVAVSFSATGASSDIMATLNGSTVSFFNGNSVGVAIIDISTAGSIPLSLVATSGGSSATVNLGNITVTQGTGKAPKVKTASVSNKSTGTKLTVTGKAFAKDSTTVTIAPTDHSATTTKVKGTSIMASYSSSECIPNGSFVNVSTPGGTSSKKITVRGTCANSLAP